MIALALSTVLLFGAAQGQSTVVITEENGDAYCDIQAKDVEVHRLVAKLGRELQLDVTGFEDVEESARVNVFLMHRPVDQALHYILGSAGLTGTIGAKRIDVRGELPPFPDSEAVRGRAELAYLTTLRHFPNSPDAPQARLALAEIALEQELPEKAVRHYELLVENSPQDPNADQARLSAGRLLVELEEWARALPHFQAIASFQLTELTPPALVPLIAEGRRELARCILKRGEARRAQFMLQGLQQSVPATEDADRAERWLLLSECFMEMGKGEEGIRYLDLAQQLGTQLVSEFRAMDLRARGMELSGKPVEASLAWLHFSRNQGIDNKRKALARAAKLALSVEGEELAVIFLYKLASKEECGEALEPYYNEARSRLGLNAASFENVTPTIQLDRGEQLLASGSKEQAAKVFANLEIRYWELSAADRLRFGMAYAPLLEEQKSVDDAIEFLRQVTRTLESRENRSRLYVLAAQIYERHDRFDEAAEAYGGKL